MRWTGQIFWLLAFGEVDSFELIVERRSPSTSAHQLSTVNHQLTRTFFPPSPPKRFGNWPSGKSYPVTAAQLLPILTGFLAPIHFSKLAKNYGED